MHDAYEKFDFEHAGLKFRCELSQDYDHGKPWEEFDGIGIVREVYATYGRPEKKAGEVVIHSDGRYYWLYDIKSTTEKAKSEHWGVSGDTSGLTNKQITALAVRRDMEYCRDHLTGNRWFSVMEVYQIDDDGDKVGESQYLGGIDTGHSAADDAYMRDEAANLASEIAHEVLRESAERTYWESRDVVTYA